MSAKEPVMSNDNIFNRIPDLNYTESAAKPCPEVFDELIRSRRSVRVYDQEQEIPEAVIRQVLSWALLAPNSSNLQCWEFIWVKDQEKKRELAKLCFDQPAARTAKELIVAVAKPSLWKSHAQLMLKHFDEQEAKGQVVPKSARQYYQKIVPFVYTQGPLSIIGLIKKPFIFLVGLFKIVPRQPTSLGELKKWAVKSTALASQNFMLGMSAHGFDTCPMEGFDETRVKKLLGLKRLDEVVMVISAGMRATNGVYGPRIRFEEKQFIRVI
jgi:nitroreductase